MTPEVSIWPPQHTNAHIPVHLNTHEHLSQAHMNKIKESLGEKLCVSKGRRSCQPTLALQVAFQGGCDPSFIPLTSKKGLFFSLEKVLGPWGILAEFL